MSTWKDLIDSLNEATSRLLTAERNIELYQSTIRNLKSILAQFERSPSAQTRYNILQIQLFWLEDYCKRTVAEYRKLKVARNQFRRWIDKKA